MSINYIYEIAKDLNVLDLDDRPDGRANNKDIDRVINKLVEKDQFKETFGIMNSRGGIFNIIPSSGSHSIYIPPLLLVPRDSVPFRDPNDPNLANTRKIQKFANALAERVDIPPRRVTLRERAMLELYIKISENTEMAKNGLYFSLLHELGHTELNHLSLRGIHKDKWQQPIHILISLLTLGTFRFFALNNYSRKIETAADAFALQYASKEVLEGGQYLLDTINNYRSSNFWVNMSLFAMKMGMSLTHHSLKTRSKRVQAKLLSL